MNMLISPQVIILCSMILLLFVFLKARSNAVSRVKLLEEKGLVKAICPMLIEYSPYLSESDKQVLFRDARILMMEVKPWETQCVNS